MLDNNAKCFIFNNSFSRKNYAYFDKNIRDIMTVKLEHNENVFVKYHIFGSHRLKSFKTCVCAPKTRARGKNTL